MYENLLLNCIFPDFMCLYDTSLQSIIFYSEHLGTSFDSLFWHLCWEERIRTVCTIQETSVL